MARKWSRTTTSEYDLVRTLNKLSEDGWQVFQIDHDPSGTWGKYVVIAWRDEDE